jgi:hypothetical protein
MKIGDMHLLVQSYIERLQVDLYQASIKQRSERQKQRNTAIENSKIARVNVFHHLSTHHF